MIKILFVIMVAISSLFGSGIKWEKDYATALKQSKALNKPLMFVISNHNCKYCVELETKTLSNPKVTQKVNSDYVAAIAYVDEKPVFPDDLYVGGTPATWFLKSDGEPMFQPVMGAVDTAHFLEALDLVKAEYKKISSKK